MANPAEVRLILNAVDNASSKIAGVTKSVTGLQKAGKVAGDAMAGMGLNITSMVNPAMMAGQVIGHLGNLTRQSVTETVAYNKEIREMAQVTGLGAEEISRIVQVGDDWGINISDLRTALGYMNKMGVTPSINNLANLADEYKNTADKSAFAEKAAKLLGRGYQTLIPLFAEGGDSLHEQTEAIEDNMIATEEAIAASRKYEVAVDGLTDSWTGFKYTIGNAVIPVLTDLMNTVQGNVGVQGDLRKAVEDGIITQKEYNITLGKYRLGLIDEAEALDPVNKKRGEEADALQLVYDAATKTYPEEHKFIQMHLDLAEATANNLIPAFGDLYDALGDVDLLMQSYTDKLLFNIAAAYLDEEAQLKLAEKLGLIDSATAEAYAGIFNLNAIYDLNKDGTIDASEATQEYLDAVLRLHQGLNDLDGTVVTAEIILNLTQFGAPPGKPGEPIPYGHSGLDMVVPPGHPNDSYPIMAESGERVIIIPPGTTKGNTTSFTMNVHTNAQSSTVMRDFSMMQAMAG